MSQGDVMGVAEVVGRVDPIDAFPTVDELYAFADRLAAAHPGRVRISDLGRSRGGTPIRAVRVGSGGHDILVFGNPHPNEPIGLATIRHLLGRLAAAEHDCLGATWHFVLCVDPDGTRLNEEWYAGPHTRTAVARHFYRPPAAEQPEWCFPTTWRGHRVGVPLPETEALMALIDRTEPALIASLHNAEFGGGFFYTTGGDPGYWAALTGLLEAAGLPLHRGEPDSPGARVWAPGVFELPPFGQMAEVLAAAGVEPVAALGGGGSRDYSARFGSALLVSELPLWIDPRVADRTPGDRSLAEVLAATAAEYRETGVLVGAVLHRLAGELSGRSPFERAVRAVLGNIPGLAAAKEALGRERPATLGEIFVEKYVWTGMLRLRVGGMLSRLLAAEAGNSPRIAAERDRFAAVFAEWCAAIDTGAPGRRVPIDRLVAVQAAAVVLAAGRVRAGLPV
ncbi:M14 family zinc carboxypeptidase [Nocardia sp. NPDC050697]|uniref:M14 family zinc carboxypeptidase n=1 Tax=Nocardia sp. NPDC050697 TaxID=3155158 RepID=UPI0033D8232D